MTTSPLTVLGAALLLILPASTAAQPPKEQPRHSAPVPKKPVSAKSSSQQPYGQWNNSWGSRPAAPPKHWTRKSDWFRHVRACQQKYRSYDARTDSYRTSAGKTRHCPPG